ncbi:hypothetical protein KP509_06G005000 [Ceratopteris richardii]|uniref:Uncharacterized protein n=1 Tax=Ceratopteris richardii TaxID=49495 RepID=A0A8T2ULG4_CERRI|nr:hypothetical protein KP509_06G005000 [Ceratopteris richardii]
MGGQTPMEMDMNRDLTEETKKTSRGGTYISCMQSGGGEDSYANISRPQNFIFRVYTRSHLSEALDYLCTSPHILKLFQRVDKEQDGEERPLVAALSPSDFRSKEPPSFPRLKVADLGCSHGRNTLDYAAYILLELQTRLLKGCSITASQTREDVTVSEIEYLFSDLPENDFNSLFRSLPSLLQGIADQAHHACKIFTGGVPGSFHGTSGGTGQKFSGLERRLCMVARGKTQGHEGFCFSVPERHEVLLPTEGPGAR